MWVTDQRNELLELIGGHGQGGEDAAPLVDDSELWKASAALRRSLSQERGELLSELLIQVVVFSVCV